MNTQKINSDKKNILGNLTKRQIKDAIGQLKLIASRLQDSLYINKLEEVEQNYKYMLHYQFEGIDDPARFSVYNNILRSLFELTDDISDRLLFEESSSFFFERLRINQLKVNNTINDYKNRLKELSTSLSVMDLIEGEKNLQAGQKKALAVQIERAAAEMFSMIYTSNRAKDADYIDYLDFLSCEDIREREKCLFISALTLSLFHRFDSRKIKVLMDSCENENIMIRQRAIVGLIVVLQIFDYKWSVYPECQQQLDYLLEEPSFKKSIVTIIKQLIRARETEKISRKLTDEIIPQMMKFNSLAGKKLNMDELMGMAEDFSEKNPEWKKELEESGLADKLQEYSNLQMEGADVFHSTFANLKSFPFFYEFSNWFLPFDTSYSELLDLFANADKGSMLYAAIVASGHMCDSDKYSFCFSLLQMPQSQRSLIMHQFSSETEELKRLQQEALALNPKINEEVISNQYIQDLYRFFKLFSSRNSFLDIFSLPINFHQKKSIYPLISEIVDLKQIASYCFDKNFLSEALSFYLLISEKENIDSGNWQKIGYCKQMLGDISGALDAYLQSDLLEPDNSWTLKRIAQLYRSEKQYEIALQYFLKLQSITSGSNVWLELNIGHCYLDMKDYEKALNEYFKVEVSDGGDNPKAWRPIAWTSFLMQRYDLAQKYYKKILNSKPTEHDFLNSGHVELVLGNKKAALNYYLSVLKLLGSNIREFEKLLDADKDVLLSAGVDNDIFSLLLDELGYKDI